MPITVPASEIRSDFDTIARLMPETDHRGPHEGWLLENLPSGGGIVLEIGCGVGYLARRLSSSFDRAVAIDFSEGMIAEAKQRTAALSPIEFVCADMFDWLARFPNAYDCIVTVGTLHHVDLRSALRAMARSLKPGGKLLILDLLRRRGLRHVWLNGVAFVIVFRGMAPWKLRRAYWRHGR